MNITCPEEFFRLQMFLPYLDRLAEELEMRFSKQKDKVFRIQKLIPKYLGQIGELRPVFEFYRPLLESDVKDFEAEFTLWEMKWKTAGSVPKGALETLNCCNPDLFPTIHMLLKVLCLNKKSNFHIGPKLWDFRFFALYRLQQHHPKEASLL